MTKYDIELSRHNDLKLLGYMMIYFTRGSLPWEDLRVATAQETNNIIAKLCRNLPKEFMTYLKYVDDLDFTNQPDYSHLREVFHELFKREGFEYDNIFDWTIKKFFMLQDNQPVVPQTQSTMISANMASASQTHLLSVQLSQKVSKRSSIRRLRNAKAHRKRRA